MGQVPITFIRQVLALVVYPPLLNDPNFPEDAKSRARAILSNCQSGTVGSYSESVGIEMIRKHVAEYIERRDGIPSNYDDIILFAGASDAVKAMIKLFICKSNGKRTGVMVPVPQYPLFSATIAEFKLHQVDYYLDENNYWSLNISELQRAIYEGRKVSNPRVMVVINPGNPSGQVLKKENIKEIVKFAYQERLVIFADEVYEDNVYSDDCKFHSFRKVMAEMGSPYNKMELASFMTCSKGYIGECGLRGGYVEVLNFDPDVKSVLIKSISSVQCPTVIGQTVLEVVVNPPKIGEESYEKFTLEKETILESLSIRARIVSEALNSIKGMSCNPIQGAMFAYPLVEIPHKAVLKAKSLGQTPDTFYAFELLEATGICVVPGCGFGQKPGTYHFRITILPPLDTLNIVLKNLKDFHEKFLEEYQ
ncbi:alanine aminotransferase 2-like isoform X2 [Ischnura elegans]|nr:alanine aminotransferase 2-like isoform X2 [Ischnura elegans]